MQQQLIEQSIESPVSSLAYRFYSRNPDERAAARAEVTDLAEKDIDLLLEILKCENKKKVGRFWKGFAFGVLLILVIQVILSVFTHLGGVTGGLFSTVPMGLGAAFAPTKLQKSAAAALANCNDIRAIGPLTGALEKQDKATIGYARSALIRLLPRLTESDAGMLDQDQRAVLHKWMLSSSGDLPSAILQALAKVGDSRAIPSLEKLVAGKGTARKQLRLRVEATDVIKLIEARLPAEKARETLLRAANAPGEPDRALLRPAGSAVDVDTTILLRPAQSD